MSIEEENNTVILARRPGPTPTDLRAMHRTNRRVIGAMFALLCAVVLGIAGWLSPDERGHSTHTQLGLDPCPWVLLYDKPCPTCGMTTAFTLAAHVHPVKSFLVQPAGFVLAVLTAVAFWGSLLVAIYGWDLPLLFPWFFRLRTLLFALVLIGLGWGYTLWSWPSHAQGGAGAQNLGTIVEQVNQS